MKISHLLLAAALFLTASVAFADNNKDKKPKDKTDQAELTTPSSSTGNGTFSWDSRTATITVFVGNDGWDAYFVCGYDKNGNMIESTKTRVVTEANESSITAANALEGYDLSKTEKDNIIHYTSTHKAYQLEVEFGEDVESIGLIGGSNNDKEKFLVYSKTNITAHKMFFSAVDEDGNILFLGQEKWASSLKYNNGAVIFVNAQAGETFGTPLPTPVVTLLIALGLGAAFVMYRNRKQQVEA